jgi:hypothetical protein
MDLLICNFLSTILMVWCILDIVYVYIKANLCHLVLWQPMACECFPKDLSEILNFKFTSKFVLIHVNIASLQI